MSSVGLIRGDVFLSTSSSAAHACHFRHALALDELRVKFMPEYFHEMNSQTDQGKSKYIVTSPDVEHAASPSNDQRESTVNDNGTNLSKGKQKATEIKEVGVGKSKDIGTSFGAEHATSPTSEWRKSTISDNGTDPADGKKKPTEIKEVWFAGSHSDVCVHLRYPLS